MVFVIMHNLIHHSAIGKFCKWEHSYLWIPLTLIEVRGRSVLRFSVCLCTASYLILLSPSLLI